MMNNIDRVKQVYINSGFNLDGHLFKNDKIKNRVRVTIRTHNRISKNDKYTIDLFCNPLINAGFKIVSYNVKSEHMPTIIPIYSFNPIRNEEIGRELMINSLKRKGTLSILVELGEETNMLNNFMPDLIDVESGDQTVADYEYRVSNPGKFESNPPYVPYMWDNLIEWGEPRDETATTDYWIASGMLPEYDTDEINLSDVYRYDCDLLDYVLFPELVDKSIVAVYLFKDEQGFVNVYDIKTLDLDMPLIVENIDPNYTLITDSQEIQAVAELIGVDLSEYGGLFVEVLDGEYGTIYGYSGAVPFNYKSVDKIQ
jgi:hypothetical protein